MFEFLSLLDLEDVRARLAAPPPTGLAESDRIDRIAVLEQIKSAAAAAQARETDALVTARGEREARAGVPAADRGRGLGAEVALARRESPVRGERSLGLAKALVREMPHALAALADGLISEWRATLVVRETGEGLCEQCNYTKELPGWSAGLGSGERHRVTVTTPTGHQYSSVAPRLTG